MVFLGEFIQSMDLLKMIDNDLPKPGSGIGYAPSKFIEPLLLMLHGGGRSIEDIRQIRQDYGLCELLGMHDIPSVHAILEHPKHRRGRIYQDLYLTILIL